MRKKNSPTSYGNPIATQDMEGQPNVAPDHSAEQSNLGDLIAHIEQTHHVFTRFQLSRITTLLEGLNDTDASTLASIRRCFIELQADLIPHLIKEERILFPYIVELGNSPSHPPHSCFGSIANLIRWMGIEHNAIKGLLTQLRELTEDYHPIAGCASGVTALYAALAELDSDLVQHIQGEEDVLFPRALLLEKEVLA